MVNAHWNIDAVMGSLQQKNEVSKGDSLFEKLKGECNWLKRKSMDQIFLLYQDGTVNRFVKRLQPFEMDDEQKKFRMYIAFLATIVVYGWWDSRKYKQLAVYSGDSDLEESKLKLKILQLEVEKLKLQV